MRAVILGTTALAMCLAGALGVLHAADAPAVTVAVLRGDGILIPIATRAGSRWAHTWPIPIKAADVPLGLDGIPKRWWGKPGPITTWHTWQIDGTVTRVVAERPSWYLAHCLQGVGLKTSLTARPPLPPPTTQPYPKLGLAASAPLTFQRIEPVDQSDRMWMPIVDKVDAAMKAAEDAMTGIPMMNVEFQMKHPMPAAERAKVPTRIESLYRAGLGGGRVLYYVEATKRYGMPPLPADRNAKAATPQKGCSVMTFGNGFFLVDADGVVPAPTLRTNLSSCDYDTVALMLPLGLVVDAGQPTWIGQLTGWDYESFVGLQWDAKRAAIAEVFATRGGWCPQDSGW
jgi:hypothetical protein